MMNLSEIKETINGGSWFVFFWVTLTLIGTAAVVRNILSWRGWFETLLTKGIVVKQASAIEFKPWLFWVAALIVAACVVLGTFLIRAELRLSAAIRAKNERTTIAYKTMEGMMWAATKIRDQHHPNELNVRKAVESVLMRFRLYNDHRVEVLQNWKIRAKSEPVNFWTIKVHGTSDATPVDYLYDIDFKIQDKNYKKLGTDVVYLPTENDSRGKSLVLYFLPQIEAAEAESREIEFTYTWPGLFGQLEQKGSEPINWSTESVDTIASVTFEFFLEKGSGQELQCMVLGAKYGNSQPVPIHDGNDKFDGWTYKIENIPAGKCKISLLLKMKKA